MPSLIGAVWTKMNGSIMTTPCASWNCASQYGDRPATVLAQQAD